MTSLEQIIIGVIVAIFASVLGALIGSKNKITREEFKEFEAERRTALETHQNSSKPHASLPCEVHKVLLEAMDKKLDKIADKLDVE